MNRQSEARRGWPGAGQEPPRKNGSGEPPEELKNTDIGNGWRFSRHHGKRFRYCREMNQYLVYDGKRWQPDQSAAEAAAKDTVRDMAESAARDPGRPENKALLQHAMRSATRSRIEAMLFTARSEPGMEIKAKDLDSVGDLADMVARVVGS